MYFSYSSWVYTWRNAHASTCTHVCTRTHVCARAGMYTHTNKHTNTCKTDWQLQTICIVDYIDCWPVLMLGFGGDNYRPTSHGASFPPVADTYKEECKQVHTCRHTSMYMWRNMYTCMHARLTHACTHTHTASTHTHSETTWNHYSATHTHTNKQRYMHTYACTPVD